MTNMVAIFTTKDQHESCDLRKSPNVANCATYFSMDVIDSDWIKRRINDRPGVQTRLGMALGLDKSATSRLVNGHRGIKSHEVARIVQFFQALDNDIPTRAPSFHGFSEPDAAPFRPKDRALSAQMFRQLAPSARAPETYRCGRDLLPFGFLTGDILIIDLGAKPADGDLCILTLADTDTGESVTMIRRYVSPWLIAPDPSESPYRLADEDQAVGLLGPIKASVRARSLR